MLDTQNKIVEKQEVSIFCFMTFRGFLIYINYKCENKSFFFDNLFYFIFVCYDSDKHGIKSLHMLLDSCVLNNTYIKLLYFYYNFKLKQSTEKVSEKIKTNNFLYTLYNTKIMLQQSVGLVFYSIYLFYYKMLTKQQNTFKVCFTKQSL